MPSPLRVIIGVLGLAALTACTMKNAEAPPLSGPSGLAISILMVADRDILTQNGLDEAAITVQALGPNGESKTVNLRAQILVDFVPQDYGTLSTKAFATPTVIRYRAPNAPTTTGGQIASSVQIAVTPVGDDFNGQVSRTIELRLVPPGIILPTNPSLVADFTFTPTTPLAFNPVSFNASTTTNSGVPCRDACTFAWNFGDGTTGTGMTTTHSFRTVGTFQVTLTVTDSRGAQTTSVQTITVGPSPIPNALFTFSPSTPGVNTDVFFNGSGSTGDRATGRTIVRYDWNFGDGSTGSGVTVTHRFSAPGNYNVVLTVTDDVGVTDEQSTSVPVVSGNPTATMTVTPNPTRIGQPTTFNASASTSTAGSTITSYSFNYGDGSPAEVSTVPIQTHIYGGTPGVGVPQVVTAILTVTDSAGRTGTFTVQVTINP